MTAVDWRHLFTVRSSALSGLAQTTILLVMVNRIPFCFNRIIYNSFLNILVFIFFHSHLSWRTSLAECLLCYTISCSLAQIEACTTTLFIISLGKHNPDVYYCTSDKITYSKKISFYPLVCLMFQRKQDSFCKIKATNFWNYVLIHCFPLLQQ